uniref:Uncharacterized protein n=1 Tax=Rhizophora mucronata TaxID=61149 RepID=A0A2P2QGN0_RHIMU
MVQRGLIQGCEVTKNCLSSTHIHQTPHKFYYQNYTPV